MSDLEPVEGFLHPDSTRNRAARGKEFWVHMTRKADYWVPVIVLPKNGPYRVYDSRTHWVSPTPAHFRALTQGAPEPTDG